MREQDERKSAGRRAAAADSGSAAGEDVSSTEEQGEASEADAPTAEEENAGMNTVLDANPLFGVQDDASEK